MIKQEVPQKCRPIISCWTLVWLLFQYHSALSQDPAFTFQSFKSIEKKALKGFVFQVINDVHSYFQCYQKCADHNYACSSVNFYPSKGVCELNYASHVTHKNYMRDDEEASYLFNLAQREDIVKSGLSAVTPVQNCQVLKNSSKHRPSGNYWLDLDASNPMTPFQGYCDMETDGGGWTLVWSFTFNRYNHFKDRANYVKPVPTNMYPASGVHEQSSTPPKSETDMNAIDFNHWNKIGNEFLIKSNINNWVACVPNGGSLVFIQEGNLACRFVKEIVTERPDCRKVPSRMIKGFVGIALMGEKMIYYFDYSNVYNWPAHDPCGMTAENHKKGVQNPHTNVYIR